MLIRKTPAQIESFLKTNLHRMDMPELWVGREPNTYGPWGKGRHFKDHEYFFNPANDKEVVRFCHMTCWDLVQTAGNQTVPLLMQITNERDPRILGERGAFPPTKKDVEIFNEAGIPPFSLESKHTIFTDFDIIGTTLAFPGFYVNLLKQMRDAGVPMRWADRDSTDELYPLLFCGGQIFAQPGPIEPVVDVVVIGEGEDGKSGSDGDEVGFPTLLLDVVKAKETGQWYSKEGRIELLHQWSRDHKWCYVPRFYKYNHVDPRTTLKHFVSYTKVFQDIPDRPKRRWILDLDAIPACTSPIINAHDPSMGLGEIEASRSCTGTCSFCAEVYRYRPYRERSVEYLVNAFRENIKNSGALAAFPTGFDFPCFSRKHELYVRLMQEVCADVDTQSSRVDHFIGKDANWARMAGQGGMRQLAVGVEGNSERLRMLMSKGATTAQIKDAFRYAMENQFKKVKFFMIADWEWERPQDTDEIIELGRELVEMKNAYGSSITLRFSWTPLLIEAQTPLQWCRAVISHSDRLEGLGWKEAIDDKKLVGVYARLKELGIGFTLGKKTEQNYYYFMQVFHMADRIAAEAMIRTAEELDQVYCGAVDRDFIPVMHKHMTELGITWNHYFRPKDLDENFWWDIVDIDVPKDFFVGYFRKMMAMIKATDPENPENTASFKGKPIPKADELVEIGVAAQKADKTLKLQKPNLEKGMLLANCDTACAACMACEENESGKVDFYRDVMNPLYWKQNKARDEKFKDTQIHVMDESSVTMKFHGRMDIADAYRFMPNDYWIACIRRAVYMADIPITKGVLKMASNSHGDVKPWVSGTDYLEFGLLRNPGLSAEEITARMNENAPVGLTFVEGKLVDREADLIKRGREYVGLFKFSLNVDMLEATASILKLQNATDSFEMSVKRDEYRKGITTVKMNVKDWIQDVWLEGDGSQLVLSMLMKYGEPTPYNVVAAVFGLSNSEVHKSVCRLDSLFLPMTGQVDFFTPECVQCGTNIPMTVLGTRFHEDYCPKCLSVEEGRLLATGA